MQVAVVYFLRSYSCLMNIYGIETDARCLKAALLRNRFIGNYGLCSDDKRFINVIYMKVCVRIESITCV